MTPIDTVAAYLPALVSFALGAALVVFTVLSALRSFVLPRGAPDLISRVTFRVIRSGFDLRLLATRDYYSRDRVLAFYAPVGLVSLLPVWLTLVTIGFAGMFYGLGVGTPLDALEASGSSLLTLGFHKVDGLGPNLLSFIAATTGLILIALLIAYLPSMYAAFSRRESAVNLLEVRAGSPPSAVELIKRYHRIHGNERLTDLWQTWESWFVDVEESHTSLAALVFFRSPQPDHSWVTAAGAVLDAAALVRSTVDVESDPRADLCIRAGYLALRHVSDFFGVPYDPDPQPSDPISVSRAEYDAACADLADAGVPLRPDRDNGWLGFAGWRVNYDMPLRALAGITSAPSAPWSADRPLHRRGGGKWSD
jgi:hypothetical protein